MRLVDADSLKENGFVVPKTLKKGDMYLEVKAEDVATETAPVRRFFINDKIIDAIPTIEAEPVKHGRWIPVDSYSAFGGDLATWEIHGNPVAFYYCSECKEQTYVDENGESILSNYCPNCGARMGEVDNG